MQKRKATRSLLNVQSVESVIDWCRLSGDPYIVSVSNYTTSIDGYLKFKFMKEEKSKRCFAAFSKIKSDIKKTNIHIDIDPSTVQYYDIDLNQRNHAKIYNVDIKSAYATILYNNGLISRATFRYILKLSKPDRLASIGMLASCKNHFTYQDGKIISEREERSELEAYFYFCCQQTYDLMGELKKICGNSFLYSWVDSVYYTDSTITPKLVAFLKSKKFQHSFEVLYNYDVIQKKDNYKIVFEKGGKRKVFNIPRTSSSFTRAIISKYVHNKFALHLNQKENGLSKKSNGRRTRPASNVINGLGKGRTGNEETGD